MENKIRKGKSINVALSNATIEGYIKARNEILEREISHRCLNCGHDLKDKIMNNEIHIHLCDRCRLDQLNKITKLLQYI